MDNTLQFPITIKIIREKNSEDAPYVAYIPEFDVSSCGLTEEVAVKNVKEALDIVLEETKKMGTLDEYLQSIGMKDKENANVFPKLIFEQYSFA